MHQVTMDNLCRLFQVGLSKLNSYIDIDVLELTLNTVVIYCNGVCIAS